MTSRVEHRVIRDCGVKVCWQLDRAWKLLHSSSLVFNSDARLLDQTTISATATHGTRRKKGARQPVKTPANYVDHAPHGALRLAKLSVFDEILARTQILCWNFVVQLDPEDRRRFPESGNGQRMANPPNHPAVWGSSGCSLLPDGRSPEERRWGSCRSGRSDHDECEEMRENDKQFFQGTQYLLHLESVTQSRGTREKILRVQSGKACKKTRSKKDSPLLPSCRWPPWRGRRRPRIRKWPPHPTNTVIDRLCNELSSATCSLMGHFCCGIISSRIFVFLVLLPSASRTWWSGQIVGLTWGKSLS